jgi:1-acylglycerone phosphate reductase
MYANDSCNAAYTKAFLDVSIPKARKLLDTNIIGPILITQTFSPLLCKAEGTVVNMGSIAPLMVAPYGGVYSGTKVYIGALESSDANGVGPIRRERRTRSSREFFHSFVPKSV